jgi:hypothetical protein
MIFSSRIALRIVRLALYRRRLCCSTRYIPPNAEGRRDAPPPPWQMASCYLCPALRHWAGPCSALTKKRPNSGRGDRSSRRPRHVGMGPQGWQQVALQVSGTSAGDWRHRRHGSGGQAAEDPGSRAEMLVQKRRRRRSAPNGRAAFSVGRPPPRARAAGGSAGPRSETRRGRPGKRGDETLVIVSARLPDRSLPYRTTNLTLDNR